MTNEERALAVTAICRVAAAAEICDAGKLMSVARRVRLVDTDEEIRARDEVTQEGYRLTRDEIASDDAGIPCRGEI